ncbi:MAG: aminotransferase class I/II-fold pyridoxal phosphate-dependent enzyme [Magnetococcales bacterium]|nr:aminotransferase class I/II-fold pyridoxal phosphate-dependent enzyme [Magnetococcales bacterium]
MIKRKIFFENLSQETIQSILDAGDEREFSEGTVVFSEGAELKGLFLVMDGLFGEFIDGKQINLYSPGDFFAEAPFFSGSLTYSEIRCLKDGVLLFLDRDRLSKLPDSEEVMRILAISLSLNMQQLLLNKKTTQQLPHPEFWNEIEARKGQLRHFMSGFQTISKNKASLALQGSVLDYVIPIGNKLINRKDPFYAWQQSRRELELWTFSYTIKSTPNPWMEITNEIGINVGGLNFASQDYLSLCSHPQVWEAAEAALKDYGPHSAGSPALQGNTTIMHQLKKELAEALQMEHVLLYPTGWGAGFGGIFGLVRKNDHICLDQLAHNCLSTGSISSTKNVWRYSHNSIDSLRNKLTHIRSRDTENAILVVTEGIFSMDSDFPDLVQYQDVCHEYGATLFVDIAHDFGSMGPGGTGIIGQQGMLGKIDLVMGSFSKTFASNGGFIATNSEAVEEYLKYYSPPFIFSNAISPLQCAVVQAALRIVRSDEGEKRRQDLFRVIHTLREEFSAKGINCIGVPSPIVPVPIRDGDDPTSNEALARVSAALAFRRGVFPNLVEYPAVSKGSPRFRMQVMAKHTEEQARKAADVITECINEAKIVLKDGRYNSQYKGIP